MRAGTSPTDGPLRPPGWIEAANLVVGQAFILVLNEIEIDGYALVTDVDKAHVIKNLAEFYKTAEEGVFKKYLPDFLQAVKESGF